MDGWKISHLQALILYVHSHGWRHPHGTPHACRHHLPRHAKHLQLTVAICVAGTSAGPRKPRGFELEPTADRGRIYGGMRRRRQGKGRRNTHTAASQGQDVHWAVGCCEVALRLPWPLGLNSQVRLPSCVRPEE